MLLQAANLRMLKRCHAADSIQHVEHTFLKQCILCDQHAFLSTREIRVHQWHSDGHRRSDVEGGRQLYTPARSLQYWGPTTCPQCPILPWTLESMLAVGLTTRRMRHSRSHPETGAHILSRYLQSHPASGLPGPVIFGEAPDVGVCVQHCWLQWGIKGQRMPLCEA